MFTDEYFERQLQQIREIRLSERKFYQKVTDLYATAFDYDKNAKTTRQFFQTVQNKMHFAVHRHTAAELIYHRLFLYIGTHRTCQVDKFGRCRTNQQGRMEKCL